MVRHWVLALALGAGLALTASVGVADAAGTDLPAPTRTDPVAGTTSTPPDGGQVFTGIRTGRHDRYDRTVFDFTGGTPNYRVEYGVLHHQAQDGDIPLAGAATLVVTFNGLNQGTADLGRVYDPRLPTLLQIKSGGQFEGYANFGLGLTDRVGFRVFTLHQPDRVVVDVAHQPNQPFQATPFGYHGTAADVQVDRVRSGRHPGYERLVFDLRDADLPSVTVGYADETSTIRVTFTAAGSPTGAPHASYTGPDTRTIGLTELRTVRFATPGAGVLTADIGTAHRHGFRVMLLQQPTRVVVDCLL